MAKPVANVIKGLSRTRSTKSFTGHSREIDRDDDVKYGVSDQIEHKKIKEGLWPHIKNFFQSMNLNLLGHGNHESGLPEMLEEKREGSIHSTIDGQKWSLDGLPKNT